MKNLKKKALAFGGAVVAASALAVTSAPEAHAYAGDWFYNNANSYDGAAIIALLPGGGIKVIYPGKSSPVGVDGFRTNSYCYDMQNINTGYVYPGGQNTYFSKANAFLSLKVVRDTRTPGC